MGITSNQAMAWAEARKHAVLITLRQDGRAQSSDVSYTVVDDAIVVSLTATRAKTANMRRDSRVVVHITDPDTWSYVSFDAVAELGPVTTDPNDEAANALVDYYGRVAGEAHPDWDEYRAAMISERRQLAYLRPSSAVGQIHG
ncbi:MAG: PPOX class F420-dependent oxidoreductase [Acidimicrobiales bacterium]|jgi:PPOX class probable F420-dependent enzyme